MARRWVLAAVVLVGIAAGGIVLTDSVDSVESAVSEGQQTLANASDGPPPNDLNETRVEALIHERINEERSERGLPQLRHAPVLQRVASNHSQAMATQGFYNHTAPDGDTFSDRYADAGYQCKVATGDGKYAGGAENIVSTYAWTQVRHNDSTAFYNSEQDVADAVVESWMQSDGHRENILQRYWHNEGIGVYTIPNPNGAGLRVYVTQNFC